MLKICKSENDSGEKMLSKSSLSFQEIEDLRLEIYDKQCAVIYNERDLEFAGKLYELFSSGAVVTTASGYAICGFISSGELKVRDFTCIPSSEPELIKKIYDRFPGQRKYIIETSTSNKFFGSLGKFYDYGMITPLSTLAQGLIDSASFLSSGGAAPYLGISLE